MSRDASRKNKISIVLRYCYNNKVYDSLLSFKVTDGLDAQSLAKSILEIMATYGLDYGSYLVGQRYNGASVMSGVNKGVQQIIGECAPYAAYVHCFAHRLNLLLVYSCKAVAEASAFFIIRTFVCLYIWITDAHKMSWSTKWFIFLLLFIYLATIKHNYRLHQADISMKKNHSLHEHRLKALTCKAIDSTSSCKSYYIQPISNLSRWSYTSTSTIKLYTMGMQGCSLQKHSRSFWWRGAWYPV